MLTLPLTDTSAQGFADRVNGCVQESVTATLTAGRILQTAKAALKHGEWERMFQDHPLAVDRPVGFSRQTAFRLMAVAKHPIVGNVAHGQHLPPSWRTLYELTKIPEGTLQAALADGRIHPDMARREVAALRDAQQQEEQVPADAARAIDCMLDIVRQSEKSGIRAEEVLAHARQRGHGAHDTAFLRLLLHTLQGRQRWAYGRYRGRRLALVGEERRNTREKRLILFSDEWRSDGSRLKNRPRTTPCPATFDPSFDDTDFAPDDTVTGMMGTVRAEIARAGGGPIALARTAALDCLISRGLALSEQILSRCEVSAEEDRLVFRVPGGGKRAESGSPRFAITTATLLQIARQLTSGPLTVVIEGQGTTAGCPERAAPIEPEGAPLSAHRRGVVDGTGHP